MTKQILDVQQMQHLQELRLKLNYNTMLSWIIDNRGKDKPLLCPSSDAIDYVDCRNYCLPAYTLQDVLDVLPKEICYENKRCWLSIDLADEKIEYYNENAVDERHSVHFEFYRSSSLIDAAYEFLCWCIEQGYVKTNKV